MAPIIPSTTALIKVGNVGTTLGNATKNMGGFRGFGGSVPASGALSMSQCQKIQYGVGYYNSWFIPTTVVNQGTWSSTSITNNGSFTYAIWLASIQKNAGWRNILNINTTTADGSRRPSIWIYANDTGLHIRQDTSLANNDGIAQTITRIAMTGAVYQIVVTQNGTNMRAYFNGALSDSVTLGGTPINAPTTDIVSSPGAGVNGTGDYGLNYLWFFPYAMTAAQVSTYYSSLSGTIGAPVLTLYTFSSINFTNAGAAGRTGPTTAQCTTTYSASNPWVTNTAYFNTSGGIQIWTVPATRSYNFTIAGARGGNVWLNGGGGGRIMTVTGLTLTQGAVLYIVIGQSGGDSTNGQYGVNISAGGGGATYVYNGVPNGTTNLMFVAAGGGGTSWSGTGGYNLGDPGQTTTTATAGKLSSSSLAGGAAGTAGGGGGGGTGRGNGFSGTNLNGGAGGTDAGTGGAGGGGGMGVGNFGATFVGGIAGGNATSSTQPGGFGGGGGGGGVAEYGGRGGGAGYNGGGGGGGAKNGAGGGGGSYSYVASTMGSTNTGHGYFTVATAA